MKGRRVCLILEGTYPFITGGVSRWVHDIVTDLSDIIFTVVHLRYGPAPEQAPFEIPPNIDQVVIVPMEEFHDADPNSKWWSEYLTLPNADVFHSLATGFAGLLGMQIKKATGSPLLLTEHGIYWREVEEMQVGPEPVIELECGFKIAADGYRLFGLTAERNHWRRSLRRIAADTYALADCITTVARSNLKYQFELDANPSRCRVIPNGVVLPEVAFKSRTHAAPHFAFVGRVTPIKDVKTLVKALAIVRQRVPGVVLSILGPLDHDTEYAAETIALAESLGLDRSVFLGEGDPYEYYEHLTALVLTSVSEALPFAALEAMSFGVPVVATNVGDCADLVHGAPGDELGDAGILTSVGDPHETARALTTIASDPAARRRMGVVARERIERYYQRESCSEAYRELYATLGDE